MTIIRVAKQGRPSFPELPQLRDRNFQSRNKRRRVVGNFPKLKSRKNFGRAVKMRVDLSMSFPLPLSKCSTGRWHGAWMLVLFAGCMSLSTPQYSAWQMPASPGPLGAQTGRETLRPQSGGAGTRVESRAPSSGRDSGLSSPSGGEVRPPATALPILPKIIPEDVTVPARLELNVAAPSRRSIGGNATYRVTVKNAGAQMIEKVSLRCVFDDALIFVGSDRNEVERRIGELAAGESKEVALSLTSNDFGSHCCRFRASTDDGTVTSDEKQVCVEFVPRVLDVSLIGPTQRTEGSRAELTLSLVNRSIRALRGLRVHMTYDAALAAREATEGVEHEAGSLTWKIDELLPMEGVHFQVEFDCRTTAHRACVFAEVTGRDLADETAEACLEIVRVPGTLDLRISDTQDPLEIGSAGEYRITVRNIGLQPAEKVQLELFPPEGIKILSASVKEGENPLPLRLQSEGRKWTFDAVGQLGPNVELVYLVRVEGTRAGLAEMRASLTSSLTQIAVGTAEPTLVVEP
jgi:uncharacterized repeat protein (TIGR01451 family)